MLEINQIKNEIISEAKHLQEPENYFKGFGESGSLIDNILVLRRCPDQLINQGKDSASEIRHKRYVLTINVMTDGIACVNEKPLLLPENCAFLIYPYQTHHYIVDQRKFFWLVFTFESLDAYPSNLMYRVSPLSAETYLIVWKLLKVYLSLQKEITENNNALLSKYLECLLLELRNSALSFSQQKHTSKEIDQRLQLFEKINGYIFRHLAEPELSVQNIAEQHYVSVSYLHSLFYKMVKQSPGKYIRTIRLDRARKLLLHHNYTIAEIAYRSGFSSPAVFSRCFHREMNITPQQYMLKIKLDR